MTSKQRVLELGLVIGPWVTSNTRIGLYNNFKWTRARQGSGFGLVWVCVIYCCFFVVVVVVVVKLWFILEFILAFTRALHWRWS